MSKEVQVFNLSSTFVQTNALIFCISGGGGEGDRGGGHDVLCEDVIEKSEPSKVSELSESIAIQIVHNII